MLRFKGKSCVVTGAGRGIGEAIARRFAAEGGQVVGAARSEDQLAALQAGIARDGGTAMVHRTDVTDPNQVHALARAAQERFGAINVWVNNAGGFTEPGGTSEWIDADPAAIGAMLQLNLAAQIYGAQAAARAMRDAGKGGVILFISSIDSLYACPGGEGLYGACKAALNHVTQTMAVELGQYGIRVNAIAPAVVETPLTAPFFPTEADRRARAALYPLQRLGKPEDVAAAAAYLCSDEAAWVSGAVLLVSGGAVYTSDPYRYLTALAQPKA